MIGPGRASTACAAALALAVPGVAQEPPRPGTIAVEPMAESAAPAAVRRAYADAVTRALGDAGFLPLPPPGGGRYVATIMLTRTARGAVATARPRGRVDMYGPSVVVGLPSDKTRLGALVVTQLTIAIRLRDSGRAVWRGSALTVQAADTPGDAPGVLAPKLANAAMRAFPADREEPVSVP